MGVRGYDGSYYNDSNERIKADNNWLQNERKNKLLEEQNKLIKEQNKKIDEQNRLKEKELNNTNYNNYSSSYNEMNYINSSEAMEIQERFDRNFQELEMKERNGTLSYQDKQLYDKCKELKKEQEDNEKRRRELEKYINTCENSIFPLMKEAGIKDPVEYFNKLYDLYSSYPEEKFLDLLNPDNYEIISEEKLKNYPNNIAEKIRLLNSMLKFNATSLIKIYIFFSVAIAIGIGISTGSFLGAIIIGLFCFFVQMLIVLTSRPSKKKIKEEKMKKIPEINAEIEKYNTNIKEKIGNWEKKIRKYEERRVNDFNYLLEIALDMENRIYNNICDEEEKKIHHYTLQFHTYPEDWEEKLADFYKSFENKIEDGTEIFENLLEEEYAYLENEKTNFKVILKDSGKQKIKVINMVRTLTGLGLKEAKDIVDMVPQVLKEHISNKEAEEIKGQFATIGAIIEIE